MEAKEIFDKYHGSYFLMDRDDVYNYYKSFNISNETERKWRIDNIDSLKRRLSKTKNMKDISNYFSRKLRSSVVIPCSASIPFRFWRKSSSRQN